MASVQVLRLYEDAAGESHFDRYEIGEAMTKFAPPALPFLVSDVTSAAGFVAVNIPVGWVGERHPSPHRQILFCMRGQLRVTASDGEIRTVGPGDAWLMEDTTGKGHESMVPSDVDFEAVIILVPQYG